MRNLLDRWDDESATQAAMNPAQLRIHAEQLVEYLIDAECTDINHEHSAVPSAATERRDLAPVITSFVDTPAKVQILSEIDIGWPAEPAPGRVGAGPSRWRASATSSPSTSARRWR